MKPIKALESLDDAIVILRSEILSITGFESQFVINALSDYGADLAKVLHDAQESINAQESIKQSSLNPTSPIDDTLILFEPMNDMDSNNNMLLQEDAYAAYKLHITIYGDHAEELSIRLKSMLLQIDEKVKLNMSGVQIAKISNIESMNEFKNEVMWQRRDFDIHFAFRRMYTFG